jgi:xanthosine phosphorylase
MTTIDMSPVMDVVQRYVPSGFVPKVGLILGSGLSSLAEQMRSVASIPYQAIPGLTSGAVSGHASLLALGYMGEMPVVCLRGRLHVYEGHPYSMTAIMMQILKRLGCQHLIATCAVGSLRAEAAPGEVMMVTDHINFQPGNPLVGPNDESVGPRFVGMEDAYDAGLQSLFRSAAQKFSIKLHEGVYLATLGPSFETPAEIRAFRAWGADAVGMSLVPEVILARHMGMKVAGIAAITNLAAGMSAEHITHEGTLHYGEMAARHIAKLIPQVLQDVAMGNVA